MNKSDRNTQLQETIVYIIVWTFVAILPIFIECWECVNGKSFEWKPVYRWWIGMIPLISLFLLNNHLLIPHLLKKRKDHELPVGCQCHDDSIYGISK